jgi:hypothetical protein
MQIRMTDRMKKVPYFSEEQIENDGEALGRIRPFLVGQFF